MKRFVPDSKRQPIFAISCLALVMSAVDCLTAIAAPVDRLFFACRADNDLYQAVQQSWNAAPQRFDEPAAAIAAAAEGSGVLLLADGYPDAVTPLTAELLQTARAKKLRLFVEYPSWLPDRKVGKPTRAAVREHGVELCRAVVASEAFGSALARLRILSISGPWYLPVESSQNHLVLARVVGFDTAVLGLPNEVHPLLFELPAAANSGDVMVAATKLSQFNTARYSPVEGWQQVWAMILDWLSPNAAQPPVKWTPVVRPSFAATEKLPTDALRQAVYRGADHFINSRFLVHPAWKDRVEKWGDYDERIAPAPTPDMPIGDGTLGLLEAFNATIDHNGNQPVRYYLRADCNAEAGMALALRGVAGDDQRSRTIAANLQDFVYFHSNLQQGPRADASNPGFGLLGWDTRSIGVGNYYADDNARALLGTIATAAALKSNRWDEPVLRSILGNFRTTGRLGFRTANLLQKDLEARGWQAYYNDSPTHFAPHFEAYPWACYLWLYHKTGYQPLLDRTKIGIERMMAAYPDNWRWTNGIQQERARMLLPLAWLVRVEDTPQHRKWLRQMFDDVVKNQVESGAIRDEIGEVGKGLFQPPTSNDAYGTNEAPLIQKNGDPVCDLLYTVNFAMLGLNEAAAATKEPDMLQAAEKLAEFLCRIQVRSQRHPELDGAWFRGFDFNRWDYWASNSDHGWGVWSTETGWTQGWIAGVLGMRLLNTSLWDLSAESDIATHMERLRPQMIPDAANVDSD